MCEYDTFNKTPLEFLRVGLTVQEICEKLQISMRVLLSKYRADLIIYVKELINQGKTQDTICKITGLSKTTLGRLKNEDENEKINISLDKREEILALSKSGLNPRTIGSTLKISIHEVREILKPEIILSFLRGNGIFNMQTEFSMDARDLTSIIKSLGFNIPPSGLAKKITEHYGDGNYPFYIPITSLVNDIMEGEIIGDGYFGRSLATVDGKRDYHDYGLSTEIKNYLEGLDNFKDLKGLKEVNDIEKIKEMHNSILEAIGNAKTSFFGLHKNIKELPIVEEISKIIKEKGYNSTIRINGDNFYFTTELSIQIQKMYERFYVNGRKILPDDFQLNEQKTFQWYIGDGSYNKERNLINLATHNFKEEETNKLANELRKKIGIEPTVNKVYDKRYPDSEYWVINIRRKDDVDKFFEYIEKSNKELLDIAKKTVPHKFKDE